MKRGGRFWKLAPIAALAAALVALTALQASTAGSRSATQQSAPWEITPVAVRVTTVFRRELARGRRRRDRKSVV